jgi:hypothetical protein
LLHELCRSERNIVTRARVLSRTNLETGAKDEDRAKDEERNSAPASCVMRMCNRKILFPTSCLLYLQAVMLHWNYGQAKQDKRMRE